MIMSEGEPNGNTEAEAQYLKTGAIVLIKNMPHTVASVERIRGSASVEIRLTNGYKHIAPKMQLFTIVGYDPGAVIDRATHNPLLTEQPNGLPPVQVIPDIGLAAYFHLSLEEIDNAPKGYRRNDKIVQLALWILEHKDNVFFVSKTDTLRDNPES